MSETKKLPCDCKHIFQDKLYGTGQRVHNKTIKIPAEWRCTVCSKVKK